jgi:hypothetical protein
MMKRLLLLLSVFFMLMTVSVMALPSTLNTGIKSFVNWQDNATDIAGSFIWASGNGAYTPPQNAGVVGNGASEKNLYGYATSGDVDRVTDYDYWSMCFWWNVTTAPAYPSNSGNAMAYFQENLFGFGWSQLDDDYKDFVIYNQDDYSEYVRWDNVLTQGVWEDVCLLSGDNSTELFVNGISQGSVVFDATVFAESGNLEFGTNGGGGEDRYIQMDEFGIWNRVLTSDEVMEFHEHGTNDETYPYEAPEAEPEPSPITGYGILGGLGTCDDTEWIAFLIFAIISVVIIAIITQLIGGEKLLAKIVPILLLLFGITIVMIWLVGC